MHTSNLQMHHGKRDPHYYDNGYDQRSNKQSWDELEKLRIENQDIKLENDYIKKDNERLGEKIAMAEKELERARRDRNNFDYIDHDFKYAIDDMSQDNKRFEAENVKLRFELKKLYEDKKKLKDEYVHDVFELERKCEEDKETLRKRNTH